MCLLVYVLDSESIGDTSMRHVKAIVIALALTLSGIAYASTQSEAAVKEGCMMEVGSCCKAVPYAQQAALAAKQPASACCKDGASCESDSSCCKEGSDCCALDCCKARVACCNPEGGCKADAPCCSAHACCAARSSVS